MSVRPLRKKEEERLLFGIHECYRGFFHIHSRVASQSRHVAVIDPARFEEFLTTLQGDSNIKESMKVLLALVLSGGLRITEALSLQRSSFEWDGGRLYFYSKVLKKRSRTERKSIVHPAATLLVRGYLMRLRAFDKLFTFDRHQALYAAKTALGETLDLHALRHSHISYLIFQKSFSLEQVSALVKINAETIALYAHLEPTPLLNDLYPKSAASGLRLQRQPGSKLRKNRRVS